LYIPDYSTDGSTLDIDTVNAIDTNATDLNRTTPAFSLTRTLSTQHYDIGTDSFSGDNDALPTDSGGIILFDPYVESGFFLNDSGSYVGIPITFT
jgi:hypothetical protein